MTRGALLRGPRDPRRAARRRGRARRSRARAFPSRCRGASPARAPNIFEPMFGIAALRRRDDAPSTDHELGVHDAQALPAAARADALRPPPREGRRPRDRPRARDLRRTSTPTSSRASSPRAARRRRSGPRRSPRSRATPSRRSRRFIAEHADLLGADFKESFETWRATSVDTEFLGRIGKLWAAPFDRPETLLVGDRRRARRADGRGAAARSAALAPDRRRPRRRQVGAPARRARPARAHARRLRGVGRDDQRGRDVHRPARGPREGGRRPPAQPATSSGSCRSCRRRSTRASTRRARRACSTRSCRTSRAARSA